ncbi:hypothetical protein O181_055893 [Austropuccinia psidii MF-1]|uniref:Uncharacterized protein n=1 Tax=Austropuccinia psidii MF-1 TaxID=1389203 RepID=A0A9Q3EC44_9BASI|nr:hypothetical protein [Austropuccinia psidii MF-1]
MESIDGKENHNAFNRRMEEKHPSTTQKSTKTSPNSQKQQFQREKPPQTQNKGNGKAPSRKPYSQGYRIPKTQLDAIKMCFRWPEP